uniref:Uncharacterized protein n=1 Tax=Anguilla anguilla TaxID=7936 RepID=A0A0E9XW70_ANGAN
MVTAGGGGHSTDDAVMQRTHHSIT